MIIFTLTNVDTQQVDFILHHNPLWEVPFVTISGESGHVFNWDFVDGSMLMDGVNMTHITITIERT